MNSSLSLLDRAALTRLKRPALQQIAIRECIKANAKSAEIVRLLLQKYPEGVPSRRTSRTLSPVTQQIIKPETDENDALPGQSKKRRVGPRLQTPSRPTISMIKLPGNKDVRFVKRQLTCLVNDGMPIRDEVEETEMILGHVMSVVNEISGDIREISWIRHKIEFDVLRELKYDRSLWDGTRVMADPRARKKWEGFLKELREEELARLKKIEQELNSQLEEQQEVQRVHLSGSTSRSDNGSMVSGRSTEGRKRPFDDLDSDGGL